MFDYDSSLWSEDREGGAAELDDRGAPTGRTADAAEFGNSCGWRLPGMEAFGQAGGDTLKRSGASAMTELFSQFAE